MQLRLCGTHVRALADQCRGQAYRQFLRQMQGGQVETLALVLIGEPPQVAHQLVTGLRQLFLQRRQRRAGLRQGGLLGQHIGIGNGAEASLGLQQVELVAL